MLKIAYLFAMLSLYTCATTKTTNTAEAKADVQQIDEKEMIEKGFSKGTITVNKSKDCPYVLTVEEYQDKLDPINLGEFFKDGQIPERVWVKFSSLRMPSRCSEARPVSINEINKRSK
ncbi:hypothetical protein ACFSJT_06945 [Aquimarina celericrescens]|uniref:Lipoprotein n=2 Tax=Aquimarina celericrescens TaxID=1964542 RepID=A0ABW5AU55_9FLAO|nr:hypothetical protein [Aquimarina celericrescens]